MTTQSTEIVETAVRLDRLSRAVAVVTVKGTAPLIMHRFDEKAKRMMLDAQQSKAKPKKAAKDPDADYQASMYRLPDGGYGMPAVAFKAATVGAARFFDKKAVNMTMLRNALFFLGEGPEQLVPIEGAPEMREDVVRVGMGTADLRYRAMFREWTATLTIVYLPTAISQESVIALVDAGGMSGVGEWRPGKAATGSYGTYEVVA